MGADEKQGLPCYYSILGVSSESSINEIKRAYRKLAMVCLTRTPSILGEANRKFQRIQEAYAVLSDHRKRAMYDAGLYDPEDQEDEGLSDFVQEMLNLMAQDRRQDKSYSTEELQTMLLEMARGNSKRARYDANRKMDSGGSHISLSGWGVYGCG
ncbi:chaperone protein [Salix suchowensis]|nr:chaperone protein [Salix suchowensis]